MTRIGIAAESVSDVRRIARLADRMVVETVDWIPDEMLPDYRTWVGVSGASWIDLHKAQTIAFEKGLRLYGHFNGEPGAVDAHMHRATLMLFAAEEQPPEVVVVVRDLDDQGPARRRGWADASRARDWPFQLVAALPDPEMEAWLVSAWRVENDTDASALDAVRTRIGFEPQRTPERLTSRNEADKRDAKRVLRELCEGGPSGDERWASARPQRLREFGAGCGLSAFLDDVQTKLVPCVAGVGPKRTSV